MSSSVMYCDKGMLHGQISVFIFIIITIIIIIIIINYSYNLVLGIEPIDSHMLIKHVSYYQATPPVPRNV